MHKLAQHQSLWRQMLQDALPAICLVCDASCARLGLLWDDCLRDIVPNQRPCSQCGLPQSQPICLSCESAPPAFSKTHTPLLYQGVLRTLITRWKFQNEPRLTSLLAGLAHQNGPTMLEAADVDVIVPLPTHWRRRWRRGFDQTWLLAHALKQQASLTPPVQSLIHRRRSTARQSELAAHLRANNVAQAFVAARPIPSRRVLLVDDVMTTGATANSAASALREAGAIDVMVWCLARVDHPPQRV